MSIQNIISSFLALLIMAFEILTAIKHKSKWLLSIPTILWMIHALIFYYCNASIENKVLVNLWSQTLRTHGYLTMLSLSIYRFLRPVNVITKRRKI